jgi:urease accessory protein
MDTEDLALLRLLQLVSPSLPVGAFAYSQGIEWAVEQGWIRDGADLAEWLKQPLHDGLGRVDLPVLLRQRRAWAAGDVAAVEHWSSVLMACRETAELRLEERNRGRAFAALLPKLGISAPGGDWAAAGRCQSAGFALAVSAWRINERQAALGYAWSWLENLVVAAVKAIPLGQSTGQQVLLELASGVPAMAAAAQAVSDADIGASAPALAIASCRHETQYTRLFRS